MKTLGYLLDILFIAVLLFICWESFDASEVKVPPINIELPAKAAWEANTGDWDGWKTTRSI